MCVRRGAVPQQLEVRREPEVTHWWMRRLTFHTQNKKTDRRSCSSSPRNLKQMLFSEVEADAAS